MFSGQDREAIEEINKLLADPSCTVDALLKCRALVPQVRNNDNSLISFLKQDENMMRLIDLIHTQTDKQTLNTIVSLFQTSNTALHRTFAESIPLADHAASVFDNVTELSKYGIGVLSRIITRSCDLWPSDMSEIFRLSSVLYAKCIENIDSLSIFHSIEGLVTESHSGIWLFLWRCFGVISDGAYKLETRHVPSSPFEINKSKITNVHIDNILALLGLFFKLKNTNQPEFKSHVIDWIEKRETMTPSILELATILTPNETIAKKCAEVLMSDASDTELSVASLQYLTHAVEHCTDDIVIHIARKCVNDMTMPNLTKNAARDLIKAYSKSSDLSTELQKTYGAAYNEHKGNLQLLSFVMALSIDLKPKEDEFIPGWKSYMENVVTRYDMEEEWDESFVFGTE